PAGLEVTAPAPRPVKLAVSAKRLRAKPAVTERVAVMVTVQVAPETESHPLQPVKSDFAAGVAVRVTTVSLTKVAEHAEPQVMPAGLDVTLPVPRPCGTTDSVNRGFTVSVELALAPVASVAVIVVDPALTPLASPVPSIVATAVLLLVHVTPPVPITVTGLSEFAFVPLPSCP